MNERMKSQIIVHGSRIHDVSFRLALLHYVKKYRFLNFEAFTDTSENEELVIIYAEGDEKKINDQVQNIQNIKPESAVVHDITVKPHTGHILPLSSFSQDLQMEKMEKSFQSLLK